MNRRSNRFYKFFPKDRIGFFDNRLVRFTPPAAFNDPFDMAPVLDSAFGKLGPGSPFPSLRESFNRIGQNLADALVNRPRYPQQFMSGLYGVLSLTTKNDTLLMWAHYASEHKGFAVEFDARHPWFNQKIAARDFGQVGVARKVTYSKDRPTIEIKKLEVGAFLTKSDDWSYEEEWRMLLPLSRCDKEIAASPHAVHLFEIPAQAIRAVIFGALMSAADREQIQKSLKDAGLKHVRLKHAILSPRQFATEIQSFKPQTPKTRSKPQLDVRRSS
jgi:hypothetical protein